VLVVHDDLGDRVLDLLERRDEHARGIDALWLDVAVFEVEQHAIQDAQIAEHILLLLAIRGRPI
jgi:hypothetical protein